MRALASIPVALAILVAAAPTWGQSRASKTVDHKVAEDDTLALLAAEYYAKREHKIFIMKANGFTHDRALRPGETLKIPVTFNVTARAGDTLEALAETHLGDPRRASFIAEFNGLSSDATIAAGQSITIPFHVSHTVESKGTLRDISLAYFGSPRYRDQLREYNFLEKNTLDKGDKVLIPIHNVRVRESKLPKLDAESESRAAKRKQLQERAQAVLPAAREAWRAGRFAEVKRSLTDLDTDYLDAALAWEVGVLLGRTYLAFDDEDSARAAFKKANERKPDQKLSTYTHSPKTIEVWTEAGGEVVGGR